MPATDHNNNDDQSDPYAFLGLTADDLADLQARRRPLGFDRGFFDYFVTSLGRALIADGIRDADVRLRGSSVHLFSGPHKQLKFSPAEIVELFVTLRHRLPTRGELDAITQSMKELFPPGKPRVTRVPFDAMHRLRIVGDRSDIDVQLSSSELHSRVRESVLELGMDLSTVYHYSPNNSDMLNGLVVSQVLLHVNTWVIQQQAILLRPLDIAAFPGSGPRREANIMSCHFKATDWIVDVYGERIDEADPETGSSA